MKNVIALFLLIFILPTNAQEIALLKYNGGGDWYANPTSLPNLIKFCNQNINTKLNSKPATVTPASPDIFDYPFIHMTGHGNVVFNDQETKNLSDYLISGGFLHIDDNFGMDPYIRKEIKKLFPDNNLVELSASNKIFQTPYTFPNGIPKIHEHDNLKPQAFGIFIEDRLVLLYTYETDLGDGWEDAEVHNNPEEVRQKALKMGANIIHYIFNN
jgi:Domain of unknown function (DUF4159)